MKSDIEEMFKTTKPSLIKIVGQEAARAEVRKEKSGNTKYYLLAGGIILIVAALVAIAYGFLPRKSGEMIPAKLIPPAPFFATETSRTISVKSSDRVGFLRLMDDAVLEREREGVVKRLLVKIQEGAGEKFLGFADFFSFWRINPPPNLLLQIGQPFMVFAYGGSGGGKMGLAVRVRDQDRALREMLLWEPSLLRDLGPLFFGEKPELVLAPFEDRTFRNIDWRYLKLSQEKDLGIGYTIFPARGLLIITVGRETMETAISRLFEAP